MGQGKHKGGSVPCQESACHKIHFAKLGEQFQGQDTLASFKAAFFHSHYFEHLQSQTKDTKSRRETTVLVGNITKAVCVHRETATTILTGFHLGCQGTICPHNRRQPYPF